MKENIAASVDDIPGEVAISTYVYQETAHYV